MKLKKVSCRSVYDHQTIIIMLIYLITFIIQVTCISLYIYFIHSEILKSMKKTYIPADLPGGSDVSLVLAAVFHSSLLLSSEHVLADDEVQFVYASNSCGTIKY